MTRAKVVDRDQGSLVISVGGWRPGKPVTKSFSGALRTSAGSLTTKRSRMDHLEEVCRRNVGHVERRILPHQHDVELAETSRRSISPRVA